MIHACMPPPDLAIERIHLQKFNPNIDRGLFFEFQFFALDSNFTTHHDTAVHGTIVALPRVIFVLCTSIIFIGCWFVLFGHIFHFDMCVGSNDFAHSRKPCLLFQFREVWPVISPRYYYIFIIVLERVIEPHGWHRRIKSS